MAEPVSFGDKVVERSVEFGREVVDEVLKRYPQPPGRVKLSREEQLNKYMQMTNEGLNELIRQHGEVSVGRYIAQMERLRQRRVV